MPATKQRTCALKECSATFEPTRDWQKYCCDAHRSLAGKRRYDEAFLKVSADLTEARARIASLEKTIALLRQHAPNSFR